MNNGFVKVDIQKKHLVTNFLTVAGNALSSFRYYNTRSVDTIKQHVVTYLYLQNNVPVAYGHLDKEDDIIWLGIAVAEKHHGKGFGKLMMQQLINFATENNITAIRLSVDKENEVAIKLYYKFGFELLNENEKTIFLVRK